MLFSTCTGSDMPLRIYISQDSPRAIKKLLERWKILWGGTRNVKDRYETNLSGGKLDHRI
jgi:hypothetical protein